MADRDGSFILLGLSFDMRKFTPFLLACLPRFGGF
ncbi:hypothetical protein J3R08_001796 [Micromonospora sp. HB375]|nr:hypothetical protein [Micromonospora sp. HB375]MDH6471304.1 hypothetical protein [Micromonospora sp. H404/HB375]